MPTKTPTAFSKTHTLRSAVTLQPSAAPDDHPLSHALAGSLGGLVSATCTHPLDVVKTRLQLPGAEEKYSGIFDAMVKMAAANGWRDLYSGLQSEYVKTSINNFTYFYWYNTLKRQYLLGHLPLTKPVQPKADGTLPPIPIAYNMVIGLIAAVMQQLTTNPITVAQNRIMTRSTRVGTREPSGLLGTIFGIVRHEGVGTLYAGLLPSLVLTFNPAIQFVLYDRLKHWYVSMMRRARKDKPEDGASSAELQPPAAVLFAIGAIAKAVAITLTYPYILAKIRLQTSKGMYSSTFDVLSKTVKQSGFLGLFAGLRAQLLKSVIAAALMFVAKEEIYDFAHSIMSVFARVPAAGSSRTPDAKPSGPAKHRTAA